jgi:hypothetical protein
MPKVADQHFAIRLGANFALTAPNQSDDHIESRLGHG